MKTTISKMFVSLLLAFTAISSANAQNTAPVAIDDIVNTNINTEPTGNVLTNDYDSDLGQTLQVNFINLPPNSQLSYSTSGEYTYTGYGQVSFVYTVCDDGNPSLCDTGRLNINISTYQILTLNPCAKNYLIETVPAENDEIYTLLEPSPYFTLQGPAIIVNEHPIIDTTLYITFERCIANICDTIFFQAFYASCFNNEPIVTCPSIPIDIYHNFSDSTIFVPDPPLYGTISIANNTIVYTPIPNFVNYYDYCLVYICGDSIRDTMFDGSIIMKANCNSINIAINVGDCIDLDSNVSGGILEGIIINSNPTNSAEWQLYENQVLLRTGVVPASQTVTVTQTMGNAIYRMAAGSQSFTYDNRVASMKDVVSKSKVTVFPNPADEILNLQVEATTYHIYELEIIDLSGKIVHQQSYTTNNFQTNVADLQAGMYLYTIKGDKQTIHQGKVSIK